MNTETLTETPTPTTAEPLAADLMTPRHHARLLRRWETHARARSTIATYWRELALAVGFVVVVVQNFIH